VLDDASQLASTSMGLQAGVLQQNPICYAFLPEILRRFTPQLFEDPACRRVMIPESPRTRTSAASCYPKYSGFLHGRTHHGQAQHR
jgi:hypothetical protein